MPKSSDTTNTPEFIRFKTEALRQIDRLSLRDWDVSFRHVVIDGDNEDAYAEVDSCFPSKVAVVTLNAKYVHDNPERLARHEISHLFIRRLGHLSEQRFLRSEEIDEAEEAMCIILEKVL